MCWGNLSHCLCEIMRRFTNQMTQCIELNTSNYHRDEEINIKAVMFDAACEFLQICDKIVCVTSSQEHEHSYRRKPLRYICVFTVGL